MFRSIFGDCVQKGFSVKDMLRGRYLNGDKLRIRLRTYKYFIKIFQIKRKKAPSPCGN